MSESQEAVMTERRLKLVDPVPNPGRRVIDRAATLAERAARDENHELAGVTPWLCRYSLRLRVADLVILCRILRPVVRSHGAY